MSKLFRVIELRENGEKLEYDESTSIERARSDCDSLGSILEDSRSSSVAIVENRLRNEVYRT